MWKSLEAERVRFTQTYYDHLAGSLDKIWKRVCTLYDTEKQR